MSRFATSLEVDGLRRWLADVGPESGNHYVSLDGLEFLVSPGSDWLVVWAVSDGRRSDGVRFGYGERMDDQPLAVLVNNAKSMARQVAV